MVMFVETRKKRKEKKRNRKKNEKKNEILSSVDVTSTLI